MSRNEHRSAEGCQYNLRTDKVLDGRNRLLACKEAGVEPTFEQFVPNGVGPVQWIAAKHTRRDLDASQRASAALALLPLLEAEAKERQLARLKRGDKCPVPESFPERGEARVKAAELTGANSNYVSDAKRIVERDASMLERIRDGEVIIQEPGLNASPIGECSCRTTGRRCKACGQPARRRAVGAS